MGKFTDLTGRRFGRLEVLEFSGFNNHRKSTWLCKCDCGGSKIVIGAKLTCGETQSCGCIQKERASISNSTHGQSNSRMYSIWHMMKDRCNRTKNKNYDLYGGSGVSVCDEWNDFSAFYDWAIKSGYSEELTIDRIDGKGNYCPENCRWATMLQQANNTSRNHIVEFNGKSQNISQWSRDLNISKKVLCERLNKLKWPVERALTEPVRKRGK